MVDVLIACILVELVLALDWSRFDIEKQIPKIIIVLQRWNIGLT